MPTKKNDQQRYPVIKQGAADNQTRTSKCQAHFSPKHLIFELPLLLHDKKMRFHEKKKALLENFYACGHVNTSTRDFIPSSFFFNFGSVSCYNKTRQDRQ